MAGFNGSGTWIAPTPVTPGTVILSSVYNTNNTDIKSGFDNTVTRDGQGVMSAPFKAVDGTVAAPGLAFNAESSTGFFRPSAGVLAATVSGVEVWRANTSGFLTLNAVDLTTTGNTILGNAVGDTLNVAGGSLRVDASGNVMVNTSSSAHKLRVYSTDATYSAKVENALGAATGYGLWVDTRWNVASNVVARFSTNSGVTDVLNLFGDQTAVFSGSVGIGTVPSGTNFHLKGAGVTIAKFETTTARGSGSVVLGINDPTGTKGYFGYGSPNDTLQIYNGLNAGMEFYTNAALRMTLDTSGNIGLGTSSGGGVRLNIASAAQPWMQLGASSLAASYMQFLRGGTATVGGYLGFDGGALLGTGTGTGFTVRSEADLILMSAATERLRINSSGLMTQNGATVGIAGNSGTALTLLANTGTYLSAKATGGQEAMVGADTGGVVIGAFSNHSLTIRTNNTDRVTVDTAGVVTANSRLDAAGFRATGNGFAGTGAGLELRWDGTSSNVISYNRSGGAYVPLVIAGSTVTLSSGAGGALAMSVDTSQRVSVGAAAPINKKFETQVSADGDGVGIYYQNTPTGSTGQHIDFYNYNNSSQNINLARVRVVCDGGAVGNESGYMGFWTKPSGGALAERLRLGNGGDVNIVAGSGNLRIGSNITRFESAEQTVSSTNFATTVVAHGGPRTPDIVQLILRCKTASNGYSVGDEVDITAHDHTMSDRSFSVWTSASQVGLMWRQSLSTAPAVPDKSTGSLATITAANWKLVFKCLWL